MSTILEAIRNSTLGRTAIGESEATNRAKREALEASLGACNARAALQRKPLAERRAAAERVFLVAKKAVVAAQQGLQRAHRELVGFDSVAVREREKIERDLLEGAGAELADFLDRVCAERERLMNWRLLDERREAVVCGYTIESGPRYGVAVTDNKQAIGRRITALGNASREATRLASTTADFADHLKKLWRDLPKESE